MNNILCPVSTEKIDKKTVRSIALLTFLVTLSVVIKPNYIAVAFLGFDFYSRSFGLQKMSLLFYSGSKITGIMPFKSEIIDKAQKIFAARVGFLFSALAFTFLMINMILAAQITMGILLLCTFLEWAKDLCIGCYVYTYFVLPFFKE
jgi:hypothetical protein